MRVTKQQIIEAAHKAGFTDKEYGLIYAKDDSDIDGEIGVEEYACGEKVVRLLRELGIEVSDDA